MLMVMQLPADNSGMTLSITLILLAVAAITIWFKVLIPLGRVLELQEDLLELRECAADPCGTDRFDMTADVARPPVGDFSSASAAPPGR